MLVPEDGAEFDGALKPLEWRRDIAGEAPSSASLRAATCCCENGSGCTCRKLGVSGFDEAAEVLRRGRRQGDATGLSAALMPGLHGSDGNSAMPLVSGDFLEMVDARERGFPSPSAMTSQGVWCCCFASFGPIASGAGAHAPSGTEASMCATWRYRQAWPRLHMRLK